MTQPQAAYFLVPCRFAVRRCAMCGRCARCDKTQQRRTSGISGPGAMLCRWEPWLGPSVPRQRCHQSLAPHLQGAGASMLPARAHCTCAAGTMDCTVHRAPAGAPLYRCTVKDARTDHCDGLQRSGRPNRPGPDTPSLADRAANPRVPSSLRRRAAQHDV